MYQHLQTKVTGIGGKHFFEQVIWNNNGVAIYTIWSRSGVVWVW